MAVKLRPPRTKNGEFVNWSHSTTSLPTAWHEPASEDQIVQIVRRATESGRRLHVVGSGHSFSPIAEPDDQAMSLDHWSGVIREAPGTITVRAGTRLRDLNNALAARQLALPIVGSITRQAIAGAIATGTHGSSLAHGNLASLVQEMKLVVGNGDVVELKAGDPRLDAARVHLGALGVVSELTLRVEPQFNLVETIEIVPIEEIAGQVDAIARSAEYVKVWWLPHTPSALIYRYERTTEAPSRRPTPQTERMLDELIVHRALAPTIFASHRLLPKSIPAVNRFITKLLFNKPRRVGRSDQLLTTPYPARHRETEAAVPLSQGGDAFERLIRLIERDSLMVNFIVELRFVRGDNGWMSPAEGGDVAQLGAYTAGEHRRYFDAFWREMRPLNARPHWGKEMDHSAQEIRELWPKTQQFNALRDEFDPQRTFANRFLDRVLGS